MEDLISARACRESRRRWRGQRMKRLRVSSERLSTEREAVRGKWWREGVAEVKRDKESSMVRRISRWLMVWCKLFTVVAFALTLASAFLWIRYIVGGVKVKRAERSEERR